MVSLSGLSSSEEQQAAWTVEKKARGQCWWGGEQVCCLRGQMPSREAHRSLTPEQKSILSHWQAVSAVYVFNGYLSHKLTLLINIPALPVEGL